MDDRHPVRLHTISDGRRHVVFCPDTLSALAVDGPTLQALEAYTETGSAAASRYGIDPEHLSRSLRQLEAPVDSPLLAEVEATADPRGTSDTSSGLNRLVLHVSNDCNLRCRYCYAQGGSYGGSRINMPREIAVAAINWAVRSVGGVERIQFFGGEPLLNPRLMIEVGEYLRVLGEAGEIEEQPALGMVTNGTLGTRRTVEMLRRYQISVTVSIDGPEPIHDALRGEGSFAKADAFAMLCLEAEGVSVDFECTWTPAHVEAGISPADCVDFFYGRYGTPVLHVVPVSAPHGSSLRLDPEVTRAAYEDAARYSVGNLVEGHLRANSLSYRVLKRLQMRREARQYCPAGLGTLAVSADGGLYPCFMFAGDERFRVWRFTTDGRVEDVRWDEVSALIGRCQKSARNECLACWAAPLCGGCLGADLVDTGDVTRPGSCEKTRAIIETVLLEVATAGNAMA